MGQGEPSVEEHLESVSIRSKQMFVQRITRKDFKESYTWQARLGLRLMRWVWPFNTFLRIDFIPDPLEEIVDEVMAAADSDEGIKEFTLGDGHVPTATPLSGQPPETPDDPRAPAPIDPATGQHKDYWVLSKAERGKGFIRPLMMSYIHVPCGQATTMALEIAETYARDPKFYVQTFCSNCKMHAPVGKFRWSGSDMVVGS